MSNAKSITEESGKVIGYDKNFGKNYETRDPSKDSDLRKSSNQPQPHIKLKVKGKLSKGNHRNPAYIPNLLKT